MAASGLSGLIPYAINFSIVAGSFIYFGRKPLAKFVFQRHQRLKDQVESAEVAKKEATKRFEEVMKSLENSEKEIELLLAETEKDAKSEALEILTRAESDAEKLKSDAERILEHEKTAQLSAMKQKLIVSAVGKAKDTLQKGMNDEVHTKMLNVAKSQLEANA